MFISYCLLKHKSSEAYDQFGLGLNNIWYGWTFE